MNFFFINERIKRFIPFFSVDGKAPPHTLLRKRKAANNDLEISLNFDAIDPLQFVLPPFVSLTKIN